MHCTYWKSTENYFYINNICVLKIRKVNCKKSAKFLIWCCLTLSGSDLPIFIWYDDYPTHCSVEFRNRTCSVKRSPNWPFTILFWTTFKQNYIFLLILKRQINNYKTLLLHRSAILSSQRTVRGQFGLLVTVQGQGHELLQSCKSNR